MPFVIVYVLFNSSITMPLDLSELVWLDSLGELLTDLLKKLIGLFLQYLIRQQVIDLLLASFMWGVVDLIVVSTFRLDLVILEYENELTFSEV